MGANAIDNTNLIDFCLGSCNISGFTPTVTYAYSGGVVTVTDSSTIPSGDTYKKTLLRLLDAFGNEVRADIDVTVGGRRYTVAPTVSFTGGGGSGATATAAIANGIVTGVTVTAAGTGYTSAPTVVFTGGGTYAIGAKATATVGSGAVTAVTMVAPAATATLSDSTLDKSKPLVLTATVLTVNHIAADGIATNLGATGSVGAWDKQQNA